MSDINRICKDGLVYALIIKNSLPKEGYNFVSDSKDSLQVGVNHYPANTLIRPHFHLPLERALHDTLEVLHIDEGRALLYIYDETQSRFYETEVASGDTIVLLKGGHSLKVLEHCRIVEVKQGPYLGAEKDKVVFTDPML